MKFMMPFYHGWECLRAAEFSDMVKRPHDISKLLWLLAQPTLQTANVAMEKYQEARFSQYGQVI